MSDPVPGNLPEASPTEKPFSPEILDKTVIAIPLHELLRSEQETLARRQEILARRSELERKRRLSKQEREELQSCTARIQEESLPKAYDVIIDLNLMYPGGRQAARERVRELLAIIDEEMHSDTDKDGASQTPAPPWINETKSQFSLQYLFGKLTGDMIRKLVSYDSYQEPGNREKETFLDVAHRAVYRIWPDFKIRSLITKTISTVKADAAHISFSAFGNNIRWAVMDSGIDAKHPHFQRHENLCLPSYIEHKDFTGEGEPTVDVCGHGTHVAGIIAGEQSTETASSDARSLYAYARQRDEHGDVTYEKIPIKSICGMAPRCKLLSLKVLDSNGNGQASNLIAAIEYIQEVNGYGRRIHIHGVNMSVGYNFEPEWFACGQSPLCVEVNRLVRSGVIVVVAAGNTGYGWAQTAFQGPVAAGMNLTINDPSNAELAVTVGSTHRDMPHEYGVSYFSSKGPTGDGRSKPDLVAPGEKILSCAAGKRLEELKEKKLDSDYLEDSGTSMAAPHVSGAMAAFLSVHSEFIGQPEKVKEIFLSTATDLKRERHFQGYGLVDLMRAIQSV